MRIIQGSRVRLAALALVFVSLCAAQARAAYPDRPVHIILGIAPGGSSDITARFLAKYLSQLWNQPVIVENRLGAAGAAAYEYVAQSKPDGYTLGITSGTFTVLPNLRTDLPYNVLTDFTPVSLAATAPSFLVVTPSMPVHNVQELIALAKSEPGKLTYGSSGVGSTPHLFTAMFGAMAHIDITHVPYKGSTAGLVGVAAGEINMATGAIPPVLAMGGKLRIIAITSPQRSPLYPSIPTISESGVPGYQFVDWYGVIAPANMPADLLNTINAAIVKVVHEPDVEAAFVKQGLEGHTDTPAQFAAFIRADLKKKAGMVKLAGLKVQ